MATTMTLDELMTTPYEDLPMGVKHQVLGEAAYYLDRVVGTHTIPGMDDYVVPDMTTWSTRCDGYLHVCLAGIWYAWRAGYPLELGTFKTGNVIWYLDLVRNTSTRYSEELLGVEVPDLPNQGTFDILLVQQRMLYLMEYLPTMKATYGQLSQGEL